VFKSKVMKITSLAGLLSVTSGTLHAQQTQQQAQQDQQEYQQSSSQSRSQRKTQARSQQQQSQKQSRTRTQSQSQSQQHSQNLRKSRASFQQQTSAIASNSDVRQFHDVLNDLLSELAYDIKRGQVNGLKNLSIRRIDVSDTLPRTYEQYVELLVTEKIRENSKIKLINCIPCKTKTSAMVEGKLMITSPLTNLQRMDEAAGQLGIENFMDVVLVYHTTHMVLAFNIFNTQSKELVWARTYNSETLRSNYQRMAVDYKQIEKGRESDTYVPDYKILIGLGGSQLPNVAGNARDKSFVGLHMRTLEKFSNRRLDFGLSVSIWTNTADLLKAYPSEGTQTGIESTYNGESRPLPYKNLLGIHALLARNFLGSIEVYDKIRHGVHLGIGAVASKGYLAPSIKTGWDVYLGRRFVSTLSAHYVTTSSILVGDDFQTSRGGGGGDFTLSYNF
jgi:hypothetical protein